MKKRHSTGNTGGNRGKAGRTRKRAEPVETPPLTGDAANEEVYSGRGSSPLKTLTKPAESPVETQGQGERKTGGT